MLPLHELRLEGLCSWEIYGTRNLGVCIAWEFKIGGIQNLRLMH